MAIILGVHFIAILPDFDLLYGMESLIPSDIHTAYSNDTILYYDMIIDGFQSLGLSEKQAVNGFKGLYLVLCLCIGAGFFSRIAAVLLLILQVSLVKSGYYFSYGVDYFSSMSLMYMMLFPSDDYISVRNLLWPIRRKSDLTPFRRLFQIHLSIAYFVSGFEKIIGYNWRNGESIWKAVHLPNFGNDFAIDFNFLGAYPGLVTVSYTHLTLPTTRRV